MECEYFTDSLQDTLPEQILNKVRLAEMIPQSLSIHYELRGLRSNNSCLDLARLKLFYDGTGNFFELPDESKLMRIAEKIGFNEIILRSQFITESSPQAK